MANTKYYGTGRRKSSVARVYLVPGTGKITINKRDIDEYLGLETLKVIVRQPLVATETVDKFDVLVNVKGGGYSGQAGAIRHGISGAPLQEENRTKPHFKAASLITKRLKKRKKKNAPGASAPRTTPQKKKSAVQTVSKWFKNPGKSRFSGVLLYLNGLIWFDQIWQNREPFSPNF